MSADQEIAQLDAALGPVGSNEGAGQDVILRRIVGQGVTVQNIDVTVRAKVRSPGVTELVAGIAQSDSLLIMSPTQIRERQWPGGELPSLTVPDPTVPRRNDKLVIGGRVANVEQVTLFVVGGTIVRIEMRASG